ncbi:hypothetical protein BH11MYX4_BH11MYX4_11130 [soil metagenome]
MLTLLNAELSRKGFGRFPLFALHPVQILTWVDAVWETWRVAQHPVSKVPDAHFAGLSKVDVVFTPATPTAPLNVTVTFSEALLRGLEAVVTAPMKPGAVAEAAKTVLETQLKSSVTLSNGAASVSFQPPFWKHLIYAYMIENTHAVEIMERVLATALTDETLGPLAPDAQQWLRATEDLFFRDGPTSLVSSITSWLRPDIRATRRNAYFRMFAMDLNHAKPDGTPYPYVKATVANVQFVRVLQDLLRELWRGYTNAANQLGPNTTDDSAIGELIDQLQTMLSSRRLSDGGGYGNLAREELVSVAMMSWFELSVAQASPIVGALKAGADTREDQLRKIGERAGLPAHAKSRSFFLLADNLPALLTSIEMGFYDSNNRANLPALYKTSGPVRDSVLAIINQWTIATGVNLKDLPASAAR